MQTYIKNDYLIVLKLVIGKEMYLFIQNHFQI